MSASDTNLKTQEKRHRGPLVGISAGLVFVGVLFAGFLIWTAYGAGHSAAESPAAVVSDVIE